MARRVAAASLAIATGAVAFAIACVDLFHSTDFKTLCTEKPNDPACGGGPVDAGDADSGVDAAKPKVDFCALSSAEARDKAIRACAYLGACGGSVDDRAFGDCLTRAQLAMDCKANPSLRPLGAYDALWSCLAQVDSCAEVENCVFGDVRQECPAVASGKFIACTDKGTGKDIRIECSAPGGGAGTRFDPCLVSSRRCTKQNDSVSTCTGAAGFGNCAAGCLGTSAVDCQLGSSTFDVGVDCANVGAGACSMELLGPACVPGTSAPPCDGGAVATCTDAGAARACVGGKEILIDCVKLGVGCNDTVTAPTYDPSAVCVRTAFAVCTEGPDTCVGDDLRTCIRGGEPYTASCKSLGLGGCKIEGGRATCTRP